MTNWFRLLCTDNQKSNFQHKLGQFWLYLISGSFFYFQFEENLRIWLSSNILVPLVKVIDKTNEALATVAPELQIGSVGVDKLKKASQNISGVKQLSNVSKVYFNLLSLKNDTYCNIVKKYSCYHNQPNPKYIDICHV